MKEFLFVTSNRDKIDELIQLTNLQIKSVIYNAPEYQGTIEKIAIEKSKHAASLLNYPVLVSCTSLEFHAMGNMPGPYIKWFIESCSLFRIYRMLSAFEDKTADEVCIYAYCEPGKEPVLFQGRQTGTIVPPIGTNGFGWDPLFKPMGYEQTHGQLSVEVKNSVSSSSIAANKLMQYL
jgi:inosine triphosphate pyrophosphatase